MPMPERKRVTIFLDNTQIDEINTRRRGFSFSSYVRDIIFQWSESIKRAKEKENS